jgi:hypothetical protein
MLRVHGASQSSPLIPSAAERGIGKRNSLFPGALADSGSPAGSRCPLARDLPLCMFFRPERCLSVVISKMDDESHLEINRKATNQQHVIASGDASRRCPFVERLDLAITGLVLPRNRYSLCVVIARQADVEVIA